MRQLSHELVTCARCALCLARQVRFVCRTEAVILKSRLQFLKLGVSMPVELQQFLLGEAAINNALSEYPEFLECYGINAWPATGRRKADDGSMQPWSWDPVNEGDPAEGDPGAAHCAGALARDALRPPRRTD